MATPPKYEDLVLKVAEMERRETALRESLTDKRDEYNKLGDRYDAIQQRLTVAEQRAEDLKKLLCDVINEAPTGFASLKVDLANRVNDALNPDTGRGGCGGGKPVPPSKPVAPPIRRVVNELVINKAEIEAHTTRNWRS